MGCGEHLFLGDDGGITCSYLHCPRPTAAHELLDDHETEHVVHLDETETAFTIRHPLRERLDDDAIMTCTLHEYLASRDGPPAAPGRYRVIWRRRGGHPSWHRLSDATR